MILDLREFEEFPAHTVMTGAPGAFDFEYDLYHGVNSVRIELDIQKAGEEYFCQGPVIASVRLECARCLKEFDFDAEYGTDFIVSSREQVEGEEGVRDDEDHAFYKGNDLRADITDIVRQALILAISMKPLCSENCLGLCPHCGADLNLGPCSCVKQGTDSRWDGLKRLLNNNT